eukprot:Sdes_comp9768_c0_seq1m1289
MKIVRIHKLFEIGMITDRNKVPIERSINIRQRQAQTVQAEILNHPPKLHIAQDKSVIHRIDAQLCVAIIQAAHIDNMPQNDAIHLHQTRMCHVLILWEQVVEIHVELDPRRGFLHGHILRKIPVMKIAAINAPILEDINPLPLPLIPRPLPHIFRPVCVEIHPRPVPRSLHPLPLIAVPERKMRRWMPLLVHCVPPKPAGSPLQPRSLVGLVGGDPVKFSLPLAHISRKTPRVVVPARILHDPKPLLAVLRPIPVVEARLLSVVEHDPPPVPLPPLPCPRVQLLGVRLGEDALAVPQSPAHVS